MPEDDDVSYGIPDDADLYVDIPTFEQILEMDDDDPTREFSRQLVFGFFDQASATFDEMTECLDNEELEKLSALGHFLKGSSATLGLKHVRDSCEMIQHWGAMKDTTGERDITKEESLKLITDILPKMRKEYDEVKQWLENFFGPIPDEEE